MDRLEDNLPELLMKLMVMYLNIVEMGQFNLLSMVRSICHIYANLFIAYIS